MTLGQMLAALYADLGYPQPSTEQVTRLTRWLNEGQRHILAQPGREQLRDNTITITTVANQSVYGMPQELAKVYAVTQVTNSQRLKMLTMDQYRTINAGQNQSSSFAYAWIPAGWGPVKKQPEGTGLWAVSTSATDTTQKVNVAGFLTNGDPFSVQSAVLTGTTRVQIGTLATWDILEVLNLDSVGAGTISIYDAASSGNELLRLQAGQTSAQFQHIRLFPTPSASSVDYKMDVCLALVDLVNTNDIPLLPLDFHDMLPLYARIREFQRAGADPRLPYADREMQQRTLALARYVEWPKDYNPVVGRALSGFGWNNLGPNFPADYVWT